MNNKYGRCSYSIAQGVVNAVSLGHLMLRVGQNGIGYARIAQAGLRAGFVLHSQGHYLGILIIKLRQGCFQLDQLVQADASGVPPVKYQHHIVFVSIIL